MIIQTQEPSFKPICILIEEEFEAKEILEFIKKSKVHNTPETINYLYEKIMENLIPIKKKTPIKNNIGSIYNEKTCPYGFGFGEEFNRNDECGECTKFRECEREFDRLEEDEE